MLFVLIATCFAEDKIAGNKAPEKVSLEELAFMSGHSRGELDGGISDEHWSEPAGDSMMGTYRYIKDGKVQMYEMMAIEQTASGPVLHLKHFNPNLEGWEEKTKVWNYPLARFSPGNAVFESPDKNTRITYRVAGNGVLEATLERTGRKTEVFSFKHSD